MLDPLRLDAAAAAIGSLEALISLPRPLPAVHLFATAVASSDELWRRHVIHAADLHALHAADAVGSTRMSP